MRRNFEMSADKIIAGPLQIMLSSIGHPDAHKYIVGLAEKSYETETPLTTIVMEDESLRPYLERLTDEQRGILSDPQNYVGRASEKALAVANSWEERLGL